MTPRGTVDVDLDGDATHRLRWVRDRWLALAALAVAVPIAAVTTFGTLYWPGRPFPGFFVLGNGIVPTIRVYDWTGGSVPFYARVLAVDDHPVKTNRDVYDYVATRAVGTPVHYRFAQGDDTFERVVPTMRFTTTHYWLTVGMFVVFGLLSLGGGIAVGILQPFTRAARAFLAQGFFGGLFALTATALYHPDLWWLSRLQLTSQVAFAAAMIHLGLVFPATRRVAARHPWTVWLAYAVAALLTGWMMVDFYQPVPGLAAYQAASLYFALAILTLIALFAYAYWENLTPSVRPLLPGVILGSALALYGFLNLARTQSDFPINLIALAGPLFYLSVGYAIVKHDLFDIDALVKQAAVYGILTVAVTVAYAATLGAVFLVLPVEARSASTFTIVFIIMVAVFFQPLRAAAQSVIDRTFYRSRLDYRRTVSDLSAALTSLLDLDEILERVGRTVTEGLQPESLAVALWHDDETSVCRYDESGGLLPASTGESLAALHGELARMPGRPWRPRLHAAPTDVATAEAAGLGAALVVPFAIGGATIGALVLGRRRSGRAFNREDVELLTTLAAQSAVAVQNAHSYRALQALNAELESKVRRRTAELESSNQDLAHAYEELKTAQAQLLTTEKMASLGLIVAGVAHEINNPLSFIVGNVEPLHQTLADVRARAVAHRDGTLSELVDRLTRILELMALGAERTAAIVQDLRTFSRLGEAEARPTDLHDAIEVSLRLLRPRWADRITIHRDYGVLQPVDVIPGQINQVFMNLLANACDAIKGRGNLWIRTRHDAHVVTIAVRDDGTGIAPEHVARVFDPFFTTKSVGQGTGLGLAITQGIVSQHGGSIRVTTELGKGTELEVALPIRPALASVPPKTAVRGGGA